MTRLVRIASAIAVMLTVFLLPTAGLVVAEQPARPRVRTIAVDPFAGRAMPGVQITFTTRRGGSVSCTTDAEGACTISAGLPGRLLVYATANGARGPSREIVLPPSGEVLVYVPIGPRS